jgi:hypothetical protein
VLQTDELDLQPQAAHTEHEKPSKAIEHATDDTTSGEFRVDLSHKTP